MLNLEVRQLVLESKITDSYSSVYGTRVEDKEISLNTVDVKNVLAIFESFDTSDPELPTLTVSSITRPNSTSSDFIIGERIIGSQSRARW